MSRNSIVVDASPREVFDVLDDACAYPAWVVGTRRIRGVDPNPVRAAPRLLTDPVMTVRNARSLRRLRREVERRRGP